MAGYLGSEAVFLSASLAEIKGDVNVDGAANIGDTLLVNRTNTDGSIITFQKDGVDIGTMGTVGGKFYIGSLSGSDAFLKYESNIISPANSAGQARDSAIDLGKSVSTFKDLYLGGGVYLGGTAAANQLNDYETGSWTPTILGEVTNGSGTYTKIGSIVTAHFRIELPNIGFSTAPASLEGIPYSSNYSGNTDSRRSAGYLSYNTDTKAAALLFETVDRVHFRADPGGAALDRGTLAGNSYWGTLVYTTDS